MINLDASPIKKSLFCLIKLAKSDVDRQFARHNIGITPLQYGVLLMTKSRPITIKEIAEGFNFKAPSIVPAVDVLEKAGYLKRAPDNADRRKIQLVITKKGADLIEHLSLNNKKDALSSAFNKLSLLKQKQLLKLLQELTDNFPK